MLEAYVVEKLANSLNERFVAVGLDRVVSKKTNAVHTVGEKIDALRSAGSVFLEVLGEPLQGVVNRADSLVLSVRREAPIQLNSAGSVMTGPHSRSQSCRNGEQIPPPCRPSVYRTTSGEGSGVGPT